MTELSYPQRPAEAFPRPPATITDAEGRSIDVRAYDEGDLEPLVEMYVAFDPADRAQGIPPAGESRIREWVDTLLADGVNVVALSGDRIVGHATLIPDPRKSDSVYELAIFVLQEYQGAGIGSSMLEHLLGYGHEQDVERIWLSVEPWNRAAIALYESVGFEAQDADSFERQMTMELA